MYGQYLGQYVWPNFFIGSTHDDSEIDFLKNWILMIRIGLDGSNGN